MKPTTSSTAVTIANGRFLLLSHYRRYHSPRSDELLAESFASFSAAFTESTVEGHNITRLGGCARVVH